MARAALQSVDAAAASDAVVAISTKQLVIAETAKQALTDPTNSLAEIAFLVGFEEQSSFSRAFKRWTGVSPSEHRATLAADR